MSENTQSDHEIGISFFLDKWEEAARLFARSAALFGVSSLAVALHALGLFGGTIPFQGLGLPLSIGIHLTLCLSAILALLARRAFRVCDDLIGGVTLRRMNEAAADDLVKQQFQGATPDQTLRLFHMQSRFFAARIWFLPYLWIWYLVGGGCLIYLGNYEWQQGFFANLMDLVEQAVGGATKVDEETRDALKKSFYQFEAYTLLSSAALLIISHLLATSAYLELFDGRFWEDLTSGAWGEWRWAGLLVGLIGFYAPPCFMLGFSLVTLISVIFF